MLRRAHKSGEGALFIKIPKVEIWENYTKTYLYPKRIGSGIMKITIDTKEDSPAEIQKAIQLLSSLLEQHQYGGQRNVFDGSDPSLQVAPQASQGGVFGNIFGDQSSPPASSGAVVGSLSAGEKTLGKYQKSGEIPQIIPY